MITQEFEVDKKSTSDQVALLMVQLERSVKKTIVSPDGSKLTEKELFRAAVQIRCAEVISQTNGDTAKAVYVLDSTIRDHL